ncbi:hypothetical protein DEU53_105144 [Pantoea sp. AG1095]|uniref:hypothetical protein n=1 Tax=Pantoea sp. AG1095 TaxID=2184004 RepID=UPI000D819FD7|nr:hypothetical protein [Pantoea sp. AG1095]PYG48726.1 hypothetical protein DEU53_105144 [Pantoea sp. AG1095]
MLAERTLENAVFNDEMNEFCRKYFIKGPIEPTREEVDRFPYRYNQLKSSLFESFVLNEEVNFKVEGENIPLCLLLNEIGLRGIEELIETKALSFTLWTPLVMYIEQSVKGVYPLCSGRHDSGPYVDPEESIIKGLGFMKSPLKRRDARSLTRKIRDCYFSVPAGMEHDCVSFAHSALDSGKLEKLGLVLNGRDKDELSTNERKILVRCASDLLGYKYVINKHATSSLTSNIQILFEDSMKKIEGMSKEEIFTSILHFEDFPDLKAVFESIGQPMDELLKLRNNKNTKKFRNWLKTINSSTSQIEVHRLYSESANNPTGFFQTRWGKATKYVSMATAGYYAGKYLQPEIGSLIGPLIAPALSGPVTDTIFDAADKYLIGHITKGWTPKIFIDDVKALKFKYSI